MNPKPMNKPLIDDLDKQLAAVGATMRNLQSGVKVVRVRNDARMLFALEEWTPGRARQEQAQILYHDLAEIRRELADNPTLAQADEAQEAAEDIETLIDLARELMQP